MNEKFNSLKAWGRRVALHMEAWEKYMNEKINSLKVWSRQSALHTGTFVFLFVLTSTILIRVILHSQNFFADWREEIAIIVVGSVVFGIVGFILYKKEDEKP